MEKIFVDKHGHALFRCPHCKFERHFDASSYKTKDSRIKIKCQCGETVPVLIEFREFYRKDVRLNGQCYLHRTKEKFPITVMDLSQRGLSFSVSFTVLIGEEETMPMAQGDIVTVQFLLDNKTGDMIEKKAEIKNVSGIRCGASFSKQEYDKELGFYLMR